MTRSAIFICVTITNNKLPAAMGENDMGFYKLCANWLYKAFNKGYYNTFCVSDGRKKKNLSLG